MYACVPDVERDAAGASVIGAYGDANTADWGGVTPGAIEDVRMRIIEMDPFEIR